MSERPTAPLKRKSISTYPLDVLSVGALSIVALAPILVLGGNYGLLNNAMFANAMMVLLNYPHFMASYAEVYRPGAFWKYKRATLIVPGVILAYTIFALAMAERSGNYFHILFVVGGVYVGWHYVGQAWGMMSAYSNLENDRFTDDERRWVRTPLYVLIIWHAALFMRLQSSPPPEWAYWYDRFQQFVGFLVPLALVLSLYGMWKYTTRRRRWPALRVWLPWASIFVWYAVFAGSRNAAFWVQIAHSIQYLIFPARMQLNRMAQAGIAPRGRALRLVLWYGGLLGTGALLLLLLPDVFKSMYAESEQPREWVRLMPAALNVFTNVHHYYTDGCIWKMRDKDVRDTMFFHLREPADAAPAV